MLYISEYVRFSEASVIYLLLEPFSLNSEQEGDEGTQPLICWKCNLSKDYILAVTQPECYIDLCNSVIDIRLHHLHQVSNM